ncbi:MAG: Heavy-metal-associated domain [Symbiobacteriaceae bacterium]|jgi:cation transport ATPase|nr:Heavy-metal-associated domain [Symbiobacteriaceae bacterium]
MKRQMIMLANLTCPSCGGKLEQATAKLPGMKSARVAFGTGALHVEYDEAQLTEAQIRTVIKQHGLDVTMTMAGK